MTPRCESFACAARSFEEGAYSAVQASGEPRSQHIGQRFPMRASALKILQLLLGGHRQHKPGPGTAIIEARGERIETLAADGAGRRPHIIGVHDGSAVETRVSERHVRCAPYVAAGHRESRVAK